VPRKHLAEVEAIAAAVAATVVVGDPADAKTAMGPQSSETQWRKVQGLIEKGLQEGAKLVCGGPGRPDGLTRGYYTKPTVFSNVRNDMVIAREEIFGPVLCILPYDTEEEAIRIANDTPYGLSSYVFGGTVEHARKVASRIRAGMVHLNGTGLDVCGSFGGYKQSGLGREWGAFGFDEFLETKSVFGTSGEAKAGMVEMPG
jgi:aldehyde dehydrogenase (NAD+)